MLKKELKRTRYYSMKRVPTKKINDIADYTVILHTPDGGTELVDTLSKRPTKVKNEPYIKNEAQRQKWQRINKKRLITRSKAKYGISVWASNKYKSITSLQLKRAYELSVANHCKQVRDDNINTKSG